MASFASLTAGPHDHLLTSELQDPLLLMPLVLASLSITSLVLIAEGAYSSDPFGSGAHVTLGGAATLRMTLLELASVSIDASSPGGACGCGLWWATARAGEPSTGGWAICATGGPESKLIVVGLVDIVLTSDTVEAELRLSGLGDSRGADLTDTVADADAEAVLERTVDWDGEEGAIGRVLALSSVRRDSSESDLDMKLDSTTEDLRGIEG